MPSSLQKPRTNARFDIESISKGSRTGDLLISTRQITPEAGNISWHVPIRPPDYGGGQYPETYDALIGLREIMERKPNHIKKKRNAPKPQLGKAILVDGDGNDNLFLVEGKQESWLLQTYQVFYLLLACVVV